MRLVTRKISNSYKFRRAGPARWWNDALQPSVFARLLASLSEFRASDFKQSFSPPTPPGGGWRRIPSLFGMPIGHFRVPNLTFKTRLSAKPLLWKWVLFTSQLKIIFISMASHLASLWKWDFLELGNGLLPWKCRFPPTTFPCRDNGPWCSGNIILLNLKCFTYCMLCFQNDSMALPLYWNWMKINRKVICLPDRLFVYFRGGLFLRFGKFP